MNYVAAYSHSEMLGDARRRARGESLTCPSCGGTDAPDRERKLYDIYMEKAPDGSIGYSYRMCKVCGFAQDTDGGRSYRVWLSVHECQPRGLSKNQTSIACRHCETTVPVVNEIAEPHRCGKYLRQGDMGYQCSTCGEWQGLASSQRLPKHCR